MRRFDAYESALAVLSTADQQDLSNEFIQGGIVDKFSLQFELGWKTLKDLLRYEGDAAAASGSPREVLKAAYRYFDFVDEELWLAMLRDRNNIMHVYDADEMQRLLARILGDYIPGFERLARSIRNRYGDELAAIA